MVEEVKAFEKENPSATCKLVTPTTSDSDAFLSPEEYSEFLMDSKVCVVPRGNNIETWRLFEAARFGCVVIAETLPDRWYYDEFPSIEVDRWKGSKNVIEEVLSDGGKAKSLHENMKRWWARVCSEKPVGSYMAKKIESKYGAESQSTQ
jgi:hypothetical protein